MRFPRTIPLAALAAALTVGCGGDDADEAPIVSDTTGADDVMSVPDSTIDRELAERIAADPRLAGEGVDVTVRSEDGYVWLLGSVPTRFEMSIAREVAFSAPGVQNVIMDSLVIESEAPILEEEEGD